MMSSPHSTNPLARLPQLVMRESKLCRKFTQYLHLGEKYEEINIFMGIGFISGRDGLSQGLPIDILNMIIVADEVRLKLSPAKPVIHLLIADHMAYQHLNGEELLLAKNVAKGYQENIVALLRSLSLQDYVNIHLSSEVIEDERFQMILKNLQSKEARDVAKSEDNLAVDVLSCQKKYTASHRFYFLNQTALVKYFKEVFQCHIKIGWSKGSTYKTILCSEHYDEPHFDRFYQQVYVNDLSFVYVDSGHNLQNDASEVPYCAPKKGNQHLRILFGQRDNVLTINPKSPLTRNIPVYYEYLTQSKAIDCSLEQMISVIQALVEEKPKQYVASLQEEFETLSIDLALNFRPTMTPGYAVFRYDEVALPDVGAIDAARKPKKLGASVLL